MTAHRSTKTGRVALGGLLTALSLVIAYLSALAPTGRLGLIALAGLVPAAGVVSGGMVTGISIYAATGILGFFLLPDKSCVLFYLLFFGCYPLVKSPIERLRRPAVEWVCKLAVFNAALTVLRAAVGAALLAQLPPLLERMWLLYAVGNAVFIVYDLGLSKLITFYARRVDSAVGRH